MARALGVITARGGSKGFPGKNLADLAGRPLIAWTIQAANAAQRLDDAIVSTDSHAIAGAAGGWGGRVPFTRPAELARDDTPHLPVMQHAIRHMEALRGWQYDYVVILQPTSPFRTGADIDAAVDLLHQTQADSVLGVAQVASPHPLKFKRIVDGFLVPWAGDEPEGARRQNLPPAWLRTGALYAVRRDVMMVQGRLFGLDQRPYVMAGPWVDIDTPADLAAARELWPDYRRGSHA